MLLLALDTATPAVTVALHDGDRVVAERSAVDPRRQGELLAPAIADVLSTAGAHRGDLTGIAVGVGPGPYTGLRVGLVTARVLAATLGVELYGVVTLDVLAAAAAPAAGGPFAVATDARRREVYWSRYDSTGRAVTAPAVDLPADLDFAGSPVAGEGPLLYPELGRPIEPRYPDAGVLAGLVVRRLALGEPVLPSDPLYLRRPDVTRSPQRKQATP